MKKNKLVKQEEPFDEFYNYLMQLVVKKNLPLPELFNNILGVNLFIRQKFLYPELSIHKKLNALIETIFKEYKNRVNLTLKKIDLSKIYTGHWHPEIRTAFKKRLNVKYCPNLVNGVIEDGKIYWQLTTFAGKLIHKNKGYPGKGGAKFSMTERQFIQFKQAGKRHKNVSLYYYRFREKMKVFQKDEEICEEAFAALYLNDKVNEKGYEIDLEKATYKISYAWRFFSSENIHIEFIEAKERPPKKVYQAITDSIKTTLNNYNDNYFYNLYKRNKIYMRNLGISLRKDTYDKTWADNGRIQNRNSSKDSQLRLWDVGIYAMLQTKKGTIESEIGFKIDLDHIPSKKTLKHFNSQLVETEQDKTPEFNSGKNTWVIAVPHSMHKQSATYAQKTQSSTFQNDITTYCNYLKSNHKKKFHFDYSKDYLTIIGAFRQLYRRQAKPHKTAIHFKSKVKNKIGTYNYPVLSEVPHSFFNERPQDRRAIDELFANEINEYAKRVKGIP